MATMWHGIWDTPRTEAVKTRVGVPHRLNARTGSTYLHRPGTVAQYENSVCGVLGDQSLVPKALTRELQGKKGWPQAHDDERPKVTSPLGEIKAPCADVRFSVRSYPRRYDYDITQCNQGEGQPVPAQRSG